MTAGPCVSKVLERECTTSTCVHTPPGKGSEGSKASSTTKYDVVPELKLMSTASEMGLLEKWISSPDEGPLVVR